MTSKVRLQPCGPVVDPAAAGRIHDLLAAAAQEHGWEAALEEAWPAMAPVFSASSYLAGLVRRSPARLAAILRDGPDGRLTAILKETAALGAGADAAQATKGLRELKAQLHLVTALSDLGGIWDLDAVTRALTLFADAALAAALAVAVRTERAEGRLTGEGALPGYFCIAMGKYGAWELNYSSDIDYSVFYHPDRLPLADGVEPAAFAIRLTQTVAQMLSDKTGDGYVFRVDLRLRPDPSATPVAVPVDAALDYYETLGQTLRHGPL